jgi:hypothetical protein
MTPIAFVISIASAHDFCDGLSVTQHAAAASARVTRCFLRHRLRAFGYWLSQRGATHRYCVIAAALTILSVVTRFFHARCAPH